uniref:Dirigent protein n=1 Tax=Triticum aestivum TaxID=4565 RepID=A0A077S6M6_WHEAT|nr:unnamed protein product [Triticum aestivum]
MAAKDPSYFKSIPLEQEIQQKELRFHLYMFQHYGLNQTDVAHASRPNSFGHTIAHDWTIREEPSLKARVVAHAQGLHLSAGMDEENWFICFNIVFADERFEASTLKVLGALTSEKDGEWAIIGGTGEFAFSQGVVKYSKISDANGYCIRELHLRALCLTFPKPHLIRTCNEANIII